MKRRQFIKLAGLTAAGLGFAGCGEISAAGKLPRRPNILWIMLDDGRADAVGCYGKKWARTPNLDRIAQNGVRFDVAIVQNPVCVPSRKSMKSGFYSHQIGPIAMGKPPETAPEYVDQAKMQQLNEKPNMLDAFTAVGMKPVNAGKIHGFRNSFDARGDAPAEINVSGNPTAYAKQTFADPSMYTPKDAVYTKTHHWMIGGISPLKPEQTQTWRLGDMAVRTLEELADKDRPFFMRASFHAPHVACRVPKEYYIDPADIDLPVPTKTELDSKSEFEKGPLHTYAGGLDLTPEQIGICRGTYYGMVSLVDTQVGRLYDVLKKKGILDNTIIVFNSDQGFQLGEHGLWKKRVFYEQNVRIPFIISCPSLLPGGKEIFEPVEMVDMMPTLMDLCGLDAHEGIRGRSLMPLITGKKKKWRRACFSEIDHSRSMYEELRKGTGRRVMVRTKEYKLVFFMDKRAKNKDGVLYDLKNDPGEKINLYNNPEYRKIASKLESLAQQWDKGENLFY